MCGLLQQVTLRVSFNVAKFIVIVALRFRRQQNIVRATSTSYCSNRSLAFSEGRPGGELNDTSCR